MLIDRDRAMATERVTRHDIRGVRRYDTSELTKCINLLSGGDSVDYSDETDVTGTHIYIWPKRIMK